MRHCGFEGVADGFRGAGWRGGWRGMYARHRLDISVEDIAFGVLWHSRRLKREKLEGEVLRLCSLEEEGLVCFSVRSGWDLWLGAQGLWAGMRFSSRPLRTLTWFGS